MKTWLSHHPPENSPTQNSIFLNKQVPCFAVGAGCWLGLGLYRSLSQQFSDLNETHYIVMPKWDLLLVLLLQVAQRRDKRALWVLSSDLLLCDSP